MKFLFFLIIFIIVGLFILIFYSIRFRNPYKLYMVFGKKGAGKTTMMTALAFKYIRQNRKVYSTVEIPGTYKLDPKKIGYVEIPPESVILVDEVGMIWDNRDFKNFKNEVRDYFKLQRHYHHIVWLFSQTWDIDIKLRTLCDELFLMINYFGVFSVAKQIKRKITVVKPSENAESRIADELVISPFFMFPFGARKWIWIPKYAKYFDSYQHPSLAHADFTFIDFPSGNIPRFIKKQRRKLEREKKRAERSRDRKKVRRIFKRSNRSSGNGSQET